MNTLIYIIRKRILCLTCEEWVSGKLKSCPYCHGTNFVSAPRYLQVQLKLFGEDTLHTLFRIAVTLIIFVGLGVLVWALKN